MATEPTNEAPSRPFLVIRGTDVTGKKKPTGYIEMLIHFVKGNVGTGIFAMGYAYSNCGMLLGPLLMVVISMIILNCQHILIQACVKITDKETVPVLPSFAETVEYTFQDSSSKFLERWSTVMGYITDVFLILGEYGFCIAYFCFVASHLGQVAAAFDHPLAYRVILVIILIPMWLSTFLGNLRILTPVMLLSNVIMWVGCCLLMYYAALELPPISDRPLVVNDIAKPPMYFGIVLFSFAAITFIIPVRMEMKKPEQFTSTFGILNVGTFIIVILYGLVGVFSYWKWGDEAKGSAFLNMPEKETLSETTKLLITVGVLLTYTLHMYVAFEIVYPRFHRRFGPFKHASLARNIFKFAAVLVTYAFANISEDLGVVISLVGSLTVGVLSMMIPPVLELVMKYGHLTYPIIIKDVIYIVLSIIGGGTGIYVSIKSIIEKFFE